MAHDHAKTPVYLRDPGRVKPPDHARVARGLTDAELEDEILSKRGDPDYQLALLTEHERRAKEGR